MPHVACELILLIVSTELRLYHTDADKSSEGAESASVYEYCWSQVAKQKDGLGNQRYVNLMLVVKAELCISHGQADVESGFPL